MNKITVPEIIVWVITMAWMVVMAWMTIKPLIKLVSSDTNENDRVTEGLLLRIGSLMVISFCIGAVAATVILPHGQ